MEALIVLCLCGGGECNCGYFYSCQGPPCGGEPCGQCNCGCGISSCDPCGTTVIGCECPGVGQGCQCPDYTDPECEFEGFNCTDCTVGACSCGACSEENCSGCTVKVCSVDGCKGYNCTCSNWCSNQASQPCQGTLDCNCIEGIACGLEACTKYCNDASSRCGGIPDYTCVTVQISSPDFNPVYIPINSSQEFNAWATTRSGTNVSNKIDWETQGGLGYIDQTTNSPNTTFYSITITGSNGAIIARIGNSSINNGIKVFEVKIYEINTPSPGNSFVSTDQLSFKAKVEGATDKNNQIDWTGVDAPGGISSGNLNPNSVNNNEQYNATPAPPPAPTGRNGPLSYKITASVELTNNLHKDEDTISQDEIDRLRQQYIDFNKNTRPTRGSFTINTSSAHYSFASLMCHCEYHSYSIVTNNLLNGLEATGTNYPNHWEDLSCAYRCPIHNANQGGAAESWHIYGRAADVDGDSNLENIAIYYAAASTNPIERILEPQTGPPYRWVHVAW